MRTNIYVLKAYLDLTFGYSTRFRKHRAPEKLAKLPFSEELTSKILWGRRYVFRLFSEKKIFFPATLHPSPGLQTEISTAKFLKKTVEKQCRVGQCVSPKKFFSS